MSDFRVSFFKTVLSSNGHRFKCLQDVIDIRSPTPDQAVAAAAALFAQQHGQRDWKIYADAIEVAPAVAAMVAEAAPRRAA